MFVNCVSARSAFPNRQNFRRRLVAVALALLAALVLPVFASASGYDVIADCNANNGLSQKYSQSDLQDALNNLPTDIDEYSDCKSIIKSALSNAGRGTVVKPALAKGGKPSKAQLAKIKRTIEREARKRSATGAGTGTAAAAVVPGDGKTLQSAIEPGMPGTLAFAIIGIALIGVAEIAGRMRRRFGAGDGPSSGSGGGDS